LAGAIADSPCRPERGPAALHRVQHSLLAAHIQVRLLLTGERHAGQVLGSSRGAHRDGQIAITQRSIRLANGLSDIIWHPPTREKRTDARRRLLQRSRIIGIGSSHHSQNSLLQTISLYKAAISSSRNIKTRGYRQASVSHAGQRSPFSSNLFQGS